MSNNERFEKTRTNLRRASENIKKIKVPRTLTHADLVDSCLRQDGNPIDNLMKARHEINSSYLQVVEKLSGDYFGDWYILELILGQGVIDRIRKIN